MRTFFASCAAAVIIAIVTALILNQVGMDTADLYSSSNVRL